MKPGPKPKPVLDRIAAKTVQAGPAECWTWGGTTRNGRPQIDKQYVSRVLLGLTKDDGLVARHTCDQPWCVNPAHLVSGTEQDNHDDAVDRGRMPRGERHWNWKGGMSKNYRTGANRSVR